MLMCVESAQYNVNTTTGCVFYPFALLGIMEGSGLFFFTKSCYLMTMVRKASLYFLYSDAQKGHQLLAWFPNKLRRLSSWFI